MDEQRKSFLRWIPSVSRYCEDGRNDNKGFRILQTNEVLVAEDWSRVLKGYTVGRNAIK